MRKALRYILILAIVGVLIVGGGLGALYLIPNTFAQDDGTQVLVIEKGQTGSEIADMLFERGLIRSTQGFKLWLYLSGTNDKLQTGHYQIPNKVTVRELISLLQEGHVESIRVTIPEGYTVGDIAIVLEKNQIMKAKDFLAEAKTFVPYPYMKGTRPATYPVEGFLFPSTYEIPVGATPREVIQMMADEMNRYLTPAVKKQIQAQHMSIHDFVTLASIVERESLFDADRPTIAGVFKKRLAHGIPLQSDATISYVLGYAKENVTIGDTQLQSPYNTYVSKGLPPGPIANPGKKSLDAVLHSENTDYLYFVADKEGHNHFSKTYEEHLAEVNKIYGADKMCIRDSCGGMSFLLIIHLLYVYITGQALNGWTTLGVSILFIGGIQLVGLGIIGEYVGRIFEEVKQRPLYWVKSAINFEEHEEAPLLGPSSADVFMAAETYTHKRKED